MILELNEIRRKVAGCWMGKNIGGTLGAPFEGKRQVFDIGFYTQDLQGNPPPNDDLDLQLVWLNAIEKHGKNVNARILGEYWIQYITPNWVEYGAGKNNLRMGLVPPLSGNINNPYKDSNGCWIRSEIWACIAPGHPEIAVRYAYEDAVVDHADEGLYAEIFCTAIESAAFVEKDRYKLIDIGLSYIPADSGVAGAVKLVKSCFDSGISWQETRIKLLTEFPSSFFSVLTENSSEADRNLPPKSAGWDAPANIGIMIIGWLYGEDDFGKSLCLAVNCGEDTDCTAATLGSILGIIHGLDNIPNKWIEPIGEKINTLCINLADLLGQIPATISELTNKVLKVIPHILGSEICDCINSTNGYTVNTLDEKNLYCKDGGYTESLKKSAYTVKYDFTIFNAYLDYTGEPFIKANTPRKFILTLENTTPAHQWLNLKWYVTEDLKVLPASDMSLFLNTHPTNRAQVEFTVEAEYLNKSKYNMVIEISSNGHPTTGLIPVILIHGQ